MPIPSFLLNKKGQGLISVIIAAGLVVLGTIAVTTVITQYNKQSVRLENSAVCLQIAQQVYNSIEKDNNALYITSFGATPGTSHWNQVAGVTTDDGVPRFNFQSGANTPVITAPAGQSSLVYSSSGTNNIANLNWTYTNYLNIKNSFSRLVALAGSGNYCCKDLNPTDANCGAVFYDQVTPRPSLDISQQNVSIDVGVNIISNGVSRCVGATLPANNLPNAQNTSANFMVRAYLNRGTQNEKVCSLQGTAYPTTQYSTIAPFVNLEFSNSGSSAICSGGGVTQPAICSASNSVVINVQTFRDTDATNKTCQNNCLKAIGNTATYPNSQVCSGMVANPSILSSISNALCGVNNCTPTEPGSFFLCRIGEYNWFKNNPDFWEPCETAKVHDFDGSQAGTVTISYPMGNSSQKSTQATITLSGLTAPRAYMVDVRAADVNGNLGPSFCSFSPSCSPASIAASTALPHFSMLSVGPTNGPIAETTQMVMPANNGATANSTVTLTAAAGGGSNGRVAPPATYTSALLAFNSNNNYQCANGAATFQVHSTYVAPNPPAGAYNTFGINFTAQLTTPAGAQAPTAAQPCDAAGNCTYTMPAASTAGNYSVTIATQNECGVTGTPAQTESWCLDNKTSFTPTAKAAPNDFSNPPTTTQWDSLLKTIPATKVCGTSVLCPTGNQKFTAIYQAAGTLPTSPVVCGPAAWLGGSCLTDPSNNYCVQVMDPCGRYGNSNPTSYDTATTCTAGISYCPIMNSCNGVSIGSAGSPSCKVDGVCNGFHYQCISGTSISHNYNSGTGLFTWVCQGSGGGANAFCSQMGAGTNGVCAATHYNCTNGTSSGGTGGISGPWSWTCLGSGGGSNASCSESKTGINGSCGATHYNCTSGTSSGGSGGISGPWSWTCQGSGGGSNASCSEGAPLNGACGATHYNCTSGTSSGGSGGSSGPWSWTCLGSGGGSNASCSEAGGTSVNGICGANHYNCTAGTSSGGSGGSLGPWSWTCLGSGGGSNASCSQGAGVGFDCCTEQSWGAGVQCCQAVDCGTTGGTPDKNGCCLSCTTASCYAEPACSLH